jgi:flavin-dependent dehydrogenase
VNVGLGVGALADRTAARRAARDLNDFLEDAARVGALENWTPRRASGERLGAWLKMGLVGTTPTRDRVLLVGDAAGLVNPLQGEGIAQAMDTGRAAAEAILCDIDQAADRYRAHLARHHLPYLSTTASTQRSLLHRPRLTAALTRGLTAPGVGRSLAGAWSIAWNNLLDGAPREASAFAATAAAGLGRLITARSSDRRWIRTHAR